MAAGTIVAVYKVLRDADTGLWLNSLEIADLAKKGKQACRRAGNDLNEAGAVDIRIVDKRKYYKMSCLPIELSRINKLQIIKDINETIAIKEKRHAN